MYSQCTATGCDEQRMVLVTLINLTPCTRMYNCQQFVKFNDHPKD